MQNNDYETESLISKISEIQNNGYSIVKIKGKDKEGIEEVVDYSIHTIVYNGDLTLDGICNVDGATLSNNVYEFGSKATDVATENENAKNMVVLKVNGNLTINEGITLTACKSDDGYGGPKGMMIYCTGTLTNNGTVSMTARGAKAEGENVYLWQNLDNSYEYVPAIGATGGKSVTTYELQQSNGIDGDVGNGRQTGGGGSGGSYAGDGDPIAISGAGGNGTSYSGGAGGGGCNINCYSTIKAEDGSSIGGNGGNGTISIGNISSGTYQSDTGNIKLKENDIELTKISNEEEVLGNNGNKIESKTEYNMEIEEKPSSAQITWKSSDENIVTVDQNGKIKFVNAGTATITCTAKTKIGIEYADSCEVTALERLYLYYYGNQFTSITGGYEKCARTGRRFSATFNDEDIYIDCNASSGGGGVYTTNSIDLTQYKYLKSYGKVASWATSDSSGRLMATTTTKSWGSAYYPSNYATFSGTSRTTELLTLTHDITSLESSYYICNGFNQSHGYLYEIWIEK